MWKVRTRKKQTEEKRQVGEAKTKQVLKSDESSYMYYVQGAKWRINESIDNEGYVCPV